MKFLSTCSQMSFQKYTWIKERQLPNSATAHFGGQKSQFFGQFLLLAAPLSFCGRCHPFQTRCLNLSGTNAAFESAPDQKSQRIQAVLEALGAFQESLLNQHFFGAALPKKLLKKFCSWWQQSQQIWILSSLSQGLTGPSKDKPWAAIFIEFLC